ncbi:hypothetical protein AGMMS49579_11190 [Spirochaetia bacterium]|nr:hypothetical protein AGMMS49579_11190 [Spirochaetia bacterium]
MESRRRCRYTEALLPGKENRISLELAGGMRNLLGPFHAAQGKVQNTNDASFRTLGVEHIDGYNLHPYGLYAPPKLFFIQENGLGEG